MRSAKSCLTSAVHSVLLELSSFSPAALREATLGACEDTPDSMVWTREQRDEEKEEEGGDRGMRGRGQREEEGGDRRRREGTEGRGGRGQRDKGEETEGLCTQ